MNTTIFPNELVSVIIPCYNSAKYLRECVESILNQTYTNLEVLITDDCSTDIDTKKILRELEHSDKRVKVFYLDRNSGPAAARNNSIEHAKGRYIAFCDSDDKWFEDKLSEQINLFKKNNYAVIYSNYEKINDKSKRTNRIVKAPKSTTYLQLLKGNTIGNLTGIYDTLKVGKIKIKPIGHEDYAMWLDILKMGWTAHNTQTVTAAYRIHSQSLSFNKIKVLRWQWNIYRKHEKLSIKKTLYYFIHYSINALLKRLI